MAQRGRKRRSGRREPNGRLQRKSIAVPSFDRGTERAQAMQALYGPDGADAIGRAYRAGLLGEGTEAKALLDMARRISNAYWQAYATGSYTCPLGDRTHGSVAELDHERIRRREEWLGACLSLVRSLGHDRAFRQLVIDVNPDHGPRWLDELIYARRTHAEPQPADTARLQSAIHGLKELAS
jgi:hypothetical protein